MTGGLNVQQGPGATLLRDGVSFRVWSGGATAVWLCLHDDWMSTETARLEMPRDEGGWFTLFVPGLAAGQRYGFRADGPHDPARGFWFDPNKLLMDPYAVGIDWPYRYSMLLAAPRWQQVDTAPMMPKALVTALDKPAATSPPLFRPGGLLYEVNVRAFTRLHPDVPPEQRGTIAALAHPAIIDHLTRLGVDAVELMPVTACIDERHLPPLGLRNAWGYNPVSFMALDPRLAPGGIAELRATVAALRDAGIGVILDLVFNHTGESDALGPTLSLRGLDNLTYYRHAPDGSLINDTGCGHTVACDQPVVRQLILDSLRHFVQQAAVDGFRFDLAPILGRTRDGFDARAETLRAIETDPVLADRILIAEPWDIGPGGYQLGAFSPRWLEWNDRCRDDIRRFWRGDHGTLGALATRLAGSSDIFGAGGADATRSVNFVAAHDGMTLADLTAYASKHNQGNGEDNRDGHDENLSWNHGIEGETDDKAVLAARAADRRALLALLFFSRGTLLLSAGDEFGRTQKGNNNAYAQDNATTWLDWQGRDQTLEAYAMALGTLRRRAGCLRRTDFLTGAATEGRTPDVAWFDSAGEPMTDHAWNDLANRRLVMVLDGGGGDAFHRIALAVNGDRRSRAFVLPPSEGFSWRPADGASADATDAADGVWQLAGRCAVIFVETMDDRIPEGH